MTVNSNCVQKTFILRVSVMIICSLKYKITKLEQKNAKSAMSDEVYVCTEKVRTLSHGHDLTSDRNVCVEKRQHLGLDKAQ